MKNKMRVVLTLFTCVLFFSFFRTSASAESFPGDDYRPTPTPTILYDLSSEYHIGDNLIVNGTLMDYQGVYTYDSLYLKAEYLPYAFDINPRLKNVRVYGITTSNTKELIYEDRSKELVPGNESLAPATVSLYTESSSRWRAYDKFEVVLTVNKVTDGYDYMTGGDGKPMDIDYSSIVYKKLH